VPRPIHDIPTNIITGFLGSGKTTAIAHLLRNKPASERWAVLVNEFGEIGVDGALIEGQDSLGGVFVREVPGGCMCCTAGVPMQQALNTLLKTARPDRLLIEPTGLGHPSELLRTLSAPHYQGVLDVQKVVCLVDARKLSDDRYTSHEIFNDQIAIADVIVGSKADLYTPADVRALQADTSQHRGSVFTMRDGALDPSWLSGSTAATGSGDRHHQGHSGPTASDMLLPPAGYVRASNEGDAFRSLGWRFHADSVFDRAKLRAFLSGLEVARAKGVFITSDGVVGFNRADHDTSETALGEAWESRFEVIAEVVDPTWESALFACIVPDRMPE